MITHYLKFATEAEALSVLAQAYPTLDEDNQPTFNPVSKDHALDIVGIIHGPTGVTLTDDEGNKYPEMAPIEGWHVNLAALVAPTELTDYVLTPAPATPSRVFA